MIQQMPQLMLLRIITCKASVHRLPKGSFMYLNTSKFWAVPSHITERGERIYISKDVFQKIMAWEYED